MIEVTINGNTPTSKNEYPKLMRAKDLPEKIVLFIYDSQGIVLHSTIVTGSDMSLEIAKGAGARWQFVKKRSDNARYLCIDHQTTDPHERTITCGNAILGGSQLKIGENDDT